MAPEFNTTRLRLRPCQLGDLEPVHALWTNDGVRRFLFDDRVISLDETRSFIESNLQNFERHGYGLWLVFARDTNHLVGFAGFLPSENDAPNLIYGIHPDFWGQGYATEAASAVLNYVFEDLALTRVRADVDEPNVVSVQVLEKLGMRRMGRGTNGGRSLLYFEESRLPAEECSSC